jgi:hypothetical protein
VFGGWIVSAPPSALGTEIKGNMDFTLLHAGLAAGAALAAIPVILHLFMKQTPKHVIFPALRLIKERQKRSKKRLRIKNWLLLLARMALLALMALALARPAWNSQASLGDREVPTALALVFDTSLSMEYKDQGQTRLDEAKKRAEEILSRLTTTSQVFVIDSAETGVPPPMNPASAKKRVSGLTIRPANLPLNVAVGLAYRAVAESDRPRHEVYVLTDLARSSWNLGRTVEGLDAARKVKLGIATYIVRLTPKDIHDVAVVEAEPASSLITQGETLTIKARIRCTGPAQQRVVEFFLDKDDRGKPYNRDKKIVDLPANGEVPIEFKTPILTPGLHQGGVGLAQGVDPLPFDDQRYFTFQVQPAMKVLVVGDRKEDRLYVADALDPSELAPGSPRPFQVDQATSAELAGRLRDSLKEYACVYVLNVPELPEVEWNQLQAYAREGGGLVFALGDRIKPENYNAPIAAQLLPAMLDKDEKAKANLTFGKADTTHPLFQQYAKELGADLSGVPIFRFWAVKPAKEARTILSYQNNAPALLERTIPGSKTGHVLLWTTPLSRSATAGWNEFPNPTADWSFFYLVNQTVPYLAGAVGEQLNYEAGQNAIIPIDPSKRFSSFVVQGPDKTPSMPLTPLVSTPSLVVQAPQALGQWMITASGAGQQQTLGFSINPPLTETELVPLETQDLDALFGKDKYALADDPESLKRATEKVRVGHEMFPWLMVLILALVTAENFLANKFYRERSTAS